MEDLQGDKEPAGRSKKEQPTKQEEGWAVQCAGHLGGQTTCYAGWAPRDSQGQGVCRVGVHVQAPSVTPGLVET